MFLGAALLSLAPLSTGSLELEDHLELAVHASSCWGIIILALVLLVLYGDRALLTI